MESKDLLSRILDFFGGLSRMGLLVMGAVLTLLISLIILGGSAFIQEHWLTPKTFRVLAQNLTPQETSRVVQYLQNNQIPYRIPSANTIEIPQENLYSEQLHLPSIGLSEASLESFIPTPVYSENSDISGADNKANLESELSHSITTLKEVSGARVLLNIESKKSPQAKVSASILVELLPGNHLNQSQIKVIKDVVMGAVPGIQAQNIVVMSNKGENLEYTNNVSNPSALSSLEQNYKSEEEKKYTEKVLHVLEPFVANENKIVANVTLDFDFSQKQMVAEEYAPKGTVQESAYLKTTGSINSLAGSRTQYAVSKTISTTHTEFAHLKRMSVTILVDQEYDATAKHYVPLDSKTLQTMELIIKQSLGFDETRGDRVLLSNIPFKSVEPIQNPSGHENKSVKTFLEIGGLFLVLLSAYFVYRKSRRSRSLSESIPPHASDKKEYLKQEIVETLAATDEVAQDEIKYALLIEKIEFIAQHYPQQIGLLLESNIAKEALVSSVDAAPYSAMNSIQKGAVLLLQLHEPLVSNVLSFMQPKTITVLSKSIAAYTLVDRQTAIAVLEEMYGMIQSNPFVQAGGIKAAKELLQKILPPENVEAVLETLSHSLENHYLFDYVASIESEQIFVLLENEHVQTIALVLAHLKPTIAAEVLSCFSDDARADIAVRMARLSDVSSSVVRRISEAFREKIEANIHQKIEVGGTKALASVLNRMGTKASRATLSKMEDVDRTLVSSLKEIVFTFEDIGQLNDADLTLLFESIDSKDLMIALKGSLKDLRDRFIVHLPQEEKNKFIDEMTLMGAVKMKDVEQAQRKIIDQLEHLISVGTIIIPASSVESA